MASLSESSTWPRYRLSQSRTPRSTGVAWYKAKANMQRLVLGRDGMCGTELAYAAMRCAEQN
eukprot:1470837-Rhodomonas_salina.1